MKILSDCRLYAFVDMSYLAGRQPASVAEQLCAGGADIVQLRAKGLPPADVLSLARAVQPVLQARGVPLVINDFPGIARDCGAPLCHLGQEDFSSLDFPQVRELMSDPHLRLGLSTHAPDQATRAMAASPAYLAVGPVFATPTKPGRPPAGLAYVQWAARHLTIPWFAIGGINLANVGEVLAAGARRIAVVSAILQAPDIAAACRVFKERLDRAP